MSYLVDTSWAVQWLRNNRDVHERLRSFEDEGLFISVISVAELYRGVFRSNNPARSESSLQDFLVGVRTLGINQEISRVFGREGVRLRQSGQTVADLDLLIASTALHYNLTLLTSDRDFLRVEGLQTIFL
jgi:tRNA(fMet)-specific endonuclease VapC